MMGRVASPSTNLTHAECRTRAESLELASYDVALDLSRAADPDAGTFPSRSTVAFTATGGDTWVDLIAERVVAAPAQRPRARRRRVRRCAAGRPRPRRRTQR